MTRMHRSHVYKRAFGNLDQEIQQGLDLSSISSVSSDSDRPLEDDWRPPSPRMPLRDDAEVAKRCRWSTPAERTQWSATEEQEIRREALKSVARDQTLALREGRPHRAGARAPFADSSGRWSIPSPGTSRPPSPLQWNANIWDEPLNAQEQIGLAYWIHRKVDFMRRRKIWEHRQDDREYRRNEQEERVARGVHAWVSGARNTFANPDNATSDESDEEEGVADRLSAHQAYKKVTPKRIWQHRRSLLQHQIETVDSEITPDFLQNVSVKGFYQVYQTLPARFRELFASIPKHIRWHPRWPAEYGRNPDNESCRESERLMTQRTLRAHRRRVQENPGWAQQAIADTAARQKEKELLSRDKLDRPRYAEYQSKKRTIRGDLGSSILTKGSAQEFSPGDPDDRVEPTLAKWNVEATNATAQPMDI